MIGMKQNPDNQENFQAKLSQSLLTVPMYQDYVLEEET